MLQIEFEQFVRRNNLFKVIVYFGVMISLVACNDEITDEPSPEPVSVSSPAPSPPVTEVETPVVDESLRVFYKCLFFFNIS